MSDVASVVDLDAYFARIGYTGSREPSFATLADLHRRHARAIPFENLDIQLGRGIRIDLPSIQQKLIRDHRGGYCFEQNALLAAVLRRLGFPVTSLLARVRWQMPADVPTALTHQLLRVETPDAGACLADVGFGSMSLFQPLRLVFDREQPGGLEPRRLVQRDGLVAHQARIGDTWGDVYVFRLEEPPAIDFELANWFTCSHAQSRFLQNLIASRAGEGCRFTLLNGEFSIRYADGRVEKQSIDSPTRLLAILAEYFDLHFPSDTRFGKPGAPWPR